MVSTMYYDLLYFLIFFSRRKGFFDVKNLKNEVLFWQWEIVKYLWMSVLLSVKCIWSAQFKEISFSSNWKSEINLTKINYHFCQSMTFVNMYDLKRKPKIILQNIFQWLSWWFNKITLIYPATVWFWVLIKGVK